MSTYAIPCVLIDVAETERRQPSPGATTRPVDDPRQLRREHPGGAPGVSSGSSFTPRRGR